MRTAIFQSLPHHGQVLFSQRFVPSQSADRLIAKPFFQLVLYPSPWLIIRSQTQQLHRFKPKR